MLAAALATLAPEDFRLVSEPGGLTVQLTPSAPR